MLLARDLAPLPVGSQNKALDPALEAARDDGDERRMTIIDDYINTHLLS